MTFRAGNGKRFRNQAPTVVAVRTSLPADVNLDSVLSISSDQADVRVTEDGTLYVDDHAVKLREHQSQEALTRIGQHVAEHGTYYIRIGKEWQQVTTENALLDTRDRELEDTIARIKAHRFETDDGTEQGNGNNPLRPPQQEPDENPLEGFWGGNKNPYYQPFPLSAGEESMNPAGTNPGNNLNLAPSSTFQATEGGTGFQTSSMDAFQQALDALLKGFNFPFAPFSEGPVTVSIGGSVVATIELPQAPTNPQTPYASDAPTAQVNPVTASPEVLPAQPVNPNPLQGITFNGELLPQTDNHQALAQEANLSAQQQEAALLLASQPQIDIHKWTPFDYLTFGVFIPNGIETPPSDTGPMYAPMKSGILHADTPLTFRDATGAEQTISVAKRVTITPSGETIIDYNIPIGENDPDPWKTHQEFAEAINAAAQLLAEQQSAGAAAANPDNTAPATPAEVVMVQVNDRNQMDTLMSNALWKKGLRSELGDDPGEQCAPFLRENYGIDYGKYQGNYEYPLGNSNFLPAVLANLNRYEFDRERYTVTVTKPYLSPHIPMTDELAQAIHDAAYFHPNDQTFLQETLQKLGIGDNDVAYLTEDPNTGSDHEGWNLAGAVVINHLVNRCTTETTRENMPEPAVPPGTQTSVDGEPGVWERMWNSFTDALGKSPLSGFQHAPELAKYIADHPENAWKIYGQIYGDYWKQAGNVVATTAQTHMDLAYAVLSSPRTQKAVEGGNCYVDPGPASCAPYMAPPPSENTTPLGIPGMDGGFSIPDGPIPPPIDGMNPDVWNMLVNNARAIATGQLPKTDLLRGLPDQNTMDQTTFGFLNLLKLSENPYGEIQNYIGRFQGAMLISSEQSQRLRTFINDLSTTFPALMDGMRTLDQALNEQSGWDAHNAITQEIDNRHGVPTETSENNPFTEVEIAILTRDTDDNIVDIKDPDLAEHTRIFKKYYRDSQGTDWGGPVDDQFKSLFLLHHKDGQIIAVLSGPPDSYTKEDFEYLMRKGYIPARDVVLWEGTASETHQLVFVVPSPDPRYQGVSLPDGYSKYLEQNPGEISTAPEATPPMENAYPDASEVYLNRTNMEGGYPIQATIDKNNMVTIYTPEGSYTKTFEEFLSDGVAGKNYEQLVTYSAQNLGKDPAEMLEAAQSPLMRSSWEAYNQFAGEGQNILNPQQAGARSIELTQEITQLTAERKALEQQLAQSGLGSDQTDQYGKVLTEINARNAELKKIEKLYPGIPQAAQKNPGSFSSSTGSDFSAPAPEATPVFENIEFFVNEQGRMDFHVAPRGEGPYRISSGTEPDTEKEQFSSAETFDEALKIANDLANYGNPNAILKTVYIVDKDGNIVWNMTNTEDAELSQDIDQGLNESWNAPHYATPEASPVVPSFQPFQRGNVTFSFELTEAGMKNVAVLPDGSKVPITAGQYQQAMMAEEYEVEWIVRAPNLVNKDAEFQDLMVDYKKAIDAGDQTEADKIAAKMKEIIELYGGESPLPPTATPTP